SPPNRASISFTTRMIPSPSAISSAQPSASPPSARISATTASTRSCFRSSTATFAPSPANTCAVARPMPLAAPVTSATLPAIERLSFLIGSMSLSPLFSISCRGETSKTSRKTQPALQRERPPVIDPYAAFPLNYLPELFMLVFRVGIMMTETTFWQETATWLLSEQALWLYSWIGLALAMALLAASVVCMTRKAQKLQSKDILQTKRGRPPVHAPAIEKRIREIQRFKETKVFNTLAFGIGIIIAGVVLPGGLLAGIVIWQDWLLPGAPALLLDDAPFLLTETGFGELALFVAQQALSGGLADMLEVYRF